MTLIAYMKKWLLAPPVPARWAPAVALAALAVPTLVRMLVDGAVTGIEIIPYSPSVLLCAVLLGWRYAALVALASALLADALFIGPRYHLVEGPTDWFGIFVFLLDAALIIFVVQAIRSLAADWRRTHATDEPSNGLVFSLDRGEAWASWYGADARVRLGPQEEVAAMMQDFLAQLEVGKRLCREAD